MRYDGSVFLWDVEMKTVNVHDYIVRKCGIAKVTHQHPNNLGRDATDYFESKCARGFGELALEKRDVSIQADGQTTQYASKVVMMSYDDYMKLLDLVYGLELIDER